MGGEIIDVIAAVIEKDGRFLICRRPACKRHGGLWEFPGGKVLPGESYYDAVRRELEEELSLQAWQIGQPLYTATESGTQYRVIFLAVHVTGEPRLHEHSEFSWCLAEKLPTYPLAPSDDRFVREYLLQVR